MPIDTITIGAGQSAWLPKGAKILAINATNGLTLSSPSNCIDTDVTPAKCYKFKWEAQVEATNQYSIVSIILDNTEIAISSTPLVSACDSIETNFTNVSPLLSYADCCRDGLGTDPISYQTTLYLNISGTFTNISLKSRFSSDVVSGDTFIYIKGELDETCSCLIV